MQLGTNNILFKCSACDSEVHAIQNNQPQHYDHLPNTLDLLVGGCA